jgi:Heterokaryon incompatibility protein (HET)
MEKSHQVAMMGKIYSSATSVLIWLGVPPVGDLLPVEIIKLVCEKVADLLQREMDMQIDKIQNLNERELQDQFGIPLPNDEIWNVVNRILDQPWFRRAWIYQEVLLARNVQLLYGDRSIPFSIDHGSSTGTLYSFEVFLLVLRLLCIIFGETYVIGFRMRLAISMVKGRALQQFYPMDLLSNLAERRFYEATNPRDKIYALLSMSKGSEEVGPVPYYSSSVALWCFKV